MGRKKKKEVKRIYLCEDCSIWEHYSVFSGTITKEVFDIVVSNIVSNLRLCFQVPDKTGFTHYASCIMVDEGTASALTFLGVSENQQRELCYWAASEFVGFPIGDLKYYDSFYDFVGMSIKDIPNTIRRHNKIYDDVYS